MKRFLALILAAATLLCLLSGCAAQNSAAAGDTAPFTDDLGRTVQLPKDLTRIAPSGSVASMVLATIAPEYMVCISSTPSSAQYKYLPENLLKLPTTGQMFGAKSTLNLETLLGCSPQVIIDIGDERADTAANLDALQRQIGVPVIFLNGDVSNMEQMYRTLGMILAGKAERGDALAEFAAETVAMAAENREKITDSERLRVMYTSGAAGLGTNAQGSTQAQVLELVGAENAIVVPDVSNRGGGNLIDLEQLYNFDPDVIVFTAGSLFDSVAADPAWQGLRAIENGQYYEVPALPYNWLSNPPSVNMLLGVWWLGNLLYPQYYSYDITRFNTHYAFKERHDELDARKVGNQYAASADKRSDDIFGKILLPFRFLLC